MITQSSRELELIWQPLLKQLKPAKILGNESAKMRTLQSTSITETSASQYAEIAGAL
jgi:hypothetical protein